MLTPEITLDSTQKEQAVLYYFGTLYYLMWQFPCEGAEILQHEGFHNRAWVESLFKLAADYGCFGRETPTKVILPFEAVRTIITPEIVARVCLADDVLRTTYYEYRLIELRTQIFSNLDANYRFDYILKRIRQACQKIRAQKKRYLRIAYGKSTKSIRKSYSMSNIRTGDALQYNLLNTFDFIPVVSSLYPRSSAIDLAPLSRIRRKYQDVFSLCEESDSSPPV